MQLTMPGVIQISLLVAMLLLNAFLCLAQTTPSSTSTSGDGTVNGTVKKLDITCTRASHLMDPHTAKRLSSMFCDRLLANFPRSMGMALTLLHQIARSDSFRWQLQHALLS